MIPGRTIARIVQIIDALASDPSGIPLGEIAARAGMTPSGAHRALSALIEAGVASQVRPRGEYRLGPRAMNWSRGRTAEDLLVACAEGPLRRAHEISGESVHLTVMRDRRMWNVAVFEGTASLVVRVAATGESLFHTTARGLVFLAYLPRAAAEDIIRRTGLPQVTARPIKDETRLWSLIAQIRRAGLVWRRDTDELGSSGVAVPVLDAAGAILACVAVSMPSVRLRDGAERIHEDAALAAARAIEAAWVALDDPS